MGERKGFSQMGTGFIRAVEQNKNTLITGSVVLYAAFYLVAGIGGISFQIQPAKGYVYSSSNSNCPAGSAWIEGNDFHWCDGSSEYYATDESGDPISLIDGSSGGPHGSVWIEGSDFHWIDSDGDEFAYTGVDTGNNPGVASGTVWIENGYIHYIDASGNERKISK